MECCYYSNGAKVWQPSAEVSDAFISQITFFEEHLNCLSGIKRRHEGGFLVDQKHLQEFILALSRFGNKTNLPARSLKEGVTILCLALLGNFLSWPKEIFELHSPEIIVWAEYCFKLDRGFIRSPPPG